MGASACCAAEEQEKEVLAMLDATGDEKPGRAQGLHDRPPPVPYEAQADLGEIQSADPMGADAGVTFSSPGVPKPVAAAREPCEHRVIEPVIFQVAVDVTGRKLGVDINGMDGRTLLVTKVSDGPIADHNRLPSSKGMEVLAGDLLVEINGCSGDSDEIVKAMRREPQLRASVRRCRERVVKLVGRADLPLGLDTMPNDVFSLCLASDAPEGSIVHEHNEVHGEFCLRKGDVIVRVNDVSGDPMTLKEALQTGSSWEIAFRTLDKRRTSYMGGHTQAA